MSGSEIHSNNFSCTKPFCIAILVIYLCISVPQGKGQGILMCIAFLTAQGCIAKVVVLHCKLQLI